MGRFVANEVDNYGGSGGSSFFTLKDDGDVARVRFMYNSMEDVVGYAVHEVEIDGKKRYVNCLRSYNEPKSKCPFCNANSFQKAKLYIPVYDIDEDEIKIMTKGMYEIYSPEKELQYGVLGIKIKVKNMEGR